MALGMNFMRNPFEYQPYVPMVRGESSRLRLFFQEVWCSSPHSLYFTTNLNTPLQAFPITDVNVPPPRHRRCGSRSLGEGEPSLHQQKK